MPRLLYYIPCNKIIIDRDGGVPSLIGVLNSITIMVGNTPADNIPFDAMMPVSWGTVTGWSREPQDEDKTYEQRNEVRSPDGEPVALSETRFSMESRTVQIPSLADVFPVGQQGIYELVLLLREADGNNEWREMFRYPVAVIHEQKREFAESKLSDSSEVHGAI